MKSYDYGMNKRHNSRFCFFSPTLLFTFTSCTTLQLLLKQFSIPLLLSLLFLFLLLLLLLLISPTSHVSSSPPSTPPIPMFLHYFFLHDTVSTPHTSFPIPHASSSGPPHSFSFHHLFWILFNLRPHSPIYCPELFSYIDLLIPSASP